jgi:succinate dehydrogenase/fumarate reductase flavoprotein subunit
MMVGPDGARFANEANSYHDVMSALFARYPEAPVAWILADAQARRRFGIGAVKPFPFPDRPHLASGYLLRAPSLRELARAMGVPETALDQTVSQFNRMADAGRDTDFGRGQSAYNTIQGDGGRTLRALRKGPFYAVKIVPGSLGTCARLKTDPSARVLGQDGTPVEGLFAVGNAAASSMGGHYPAGGVTLGPAMTFGFIAGHVLAGQPLGAMEEMP